MGCGWSLGLPLPRGIPEQSRVVTCEGLEVLLPQQMFLLVMQRTEELPACLTVQVLVSMPLWTARMSEQGGGLFGGL